MGGVGGGVERADARPDCPTGAPTRQESESWHRDADESPSRAAGADVSVFCVPGEAVKGASDLNGRPRCGGDLLRLHRFPRSLASTQRGAARHREVRRATGVLSVAVTFVRHDRMRDD